MLADYVAAGFAADDFWALTPRLWLLQMEAAARRERRQHEAAITTAWLTVKLSRAAKLPPLKRLLKASAAPGAGDPAAQLAALKTGLPRITLEEWKARHG